MKGRGLWMVIGCLIPLVLIFIGPSLGIKGDLLLFIFIVMMFGCHLLMMKGHKEHHGKQDENKEEKHGQH